MRVTRLARMLAWYRAGELLAACEGAATIEQKRTTQTRALRARGLRRRGNRLVLTRRDWGALRGRSWDASGIKSPLTSLKAAVSGVLSQGTTLITSCVLRSADR